MNEKNNIEDYFKKKLESQEFAYQEADWLSLEQRLNEAGLSTTRQGIAIRTSKWAAILLVLLTTAFVTGWFARDIFNDGSISEVQKNSSNQPNRSEKANVVKKPVPPVVDQTEPPGQSAIHQHQNAENKTDHTPATSAFEEENNAQEPITRENQIGHVSGSDTERKKNVQYEKNTDDFLSEAYTGEEKSDHPYSERNNEPATQITPRWPENLFMTDEKSGYHMSFAQTGKPYSQDLPDISSHDKWAIGLSLASDFNSVGFPHEKKATARIGALVFYSISPKWSLSAGVLYSRKKYNSHGEYYNPPEGYWANQTNGLLPDRISGSCRVIDFPVMVSYRFMQKKSMAFSVSAGISSYYMLDEEYAYEFDQNVTDAADGWQTQENSWIPLGVANFSMGMDLRITHNAVLSFEPFLKVPSQKIGWPNLELYSMGMQLAIKYNMKQE